MVYRVAPLLMLVAGAALALASSGCSHHNKVDNDCHVVCIVVTPAGTPHRDEVFVAPIRSVGCNTPCGQMASETRYADNLSVALTGTEARLDLGTPDDVSCVASFEVPIIANPGKELVATWHGSCAIAHGAEGAIAEFEFGVGQTTVRATLQNGVLTGPGLSGDPGRFQVNIPIKDLESLPAFTLSNRTMVRQLSFWAKVRAHRSSTTQTLIVSIDAVDIAPPSSTERPFTP